VPGTQLQETQCQFCVICIISLIIDIISIISVISKTFYIQFLHLSPFSSFSLPLVGGQGLTESICHSVYCRPALKGDNTLSPLKNIQSFHYFNIFNFFFFVFLKMCALMATLFISFLSPKRLFSLLTVCEITQSNNLPS